MEHLNQEELILLHYGEAIRSGTREHLLACQSCRAESDRLRRILDAVDDVEMEDLAPAWEAHFWNRLRWKLERRPRARFAWAAAAVLVVAFLAGRVFERSTRATHPSLPHLVAHQNTPAGDAAGRERVLLVVLGDHLSRSERVLTEVKNSNTGVVPAAIADRDTIEDLVRKNRLYIEAANDSGQASLARVLGELQPILLELARAPEKPSPEDIQTLQKRIEKRGAVLKLRMAGERVRQQQSL
jgi:hypothetical protein